jgi:hypothetical protein
MALDIAKLLDDLTGRYDIDLTKLPEDARYMFRILGDLQNDIAVDLIPNYSVPRTKDPGWSTLYNVVKKSATISNDVSISLNEFFDKLVEMIKKYFPNDDLSEVKDLINNFNIELDKYKY